MDWVTGLQNAINYIEDHLTEEIDYEQVAKQAACSSFYFQRIFGILCGYSIGEYIRNRRLSLAGSELRASDRKVIDVALKYGYESPESFARAFFRFHGITPSDAKKNGCGLKSFSRLSVKISLCGGNIMNYKIIDKDAFYVLEKAELHSTENAENNKTVPDFWMRAHLDGTIEKLLKITSDRAYVFGVCYGYAVEPGMFEYSIAAVCDADTVAPEGYRKNVIPARTWAVFECKGAMPKAIQELMKKIMTEFFPTSGYRPTYEFDIEAYPDGDTSNDDYLSEIWIPVIKNQSSDI